MNVDPFAPTQGKAFHSDAVYRINVDNDGDSRADVAFSFVFSPPQGGEQAATVYHATAERARDYEADGEVPIQGARVCFGSTAQAVDTADIQFFVGLRSDPFFADLDGNLHNFQWTGVDSMADKNVFGIVLKVPDQLLGEGPKIGVWARVSLHRDGKLVSIHRGARLPQTGEGQDGAATKASSDLMCKPSRTNATGSTRQPQAMPHRRTTAVSNNEVCQHDHG